MRQKTIVVGIFAVLLSLSTVHFSNADNTNWFEQMNLVEVTPTVLKLGESVLSADGNALVTPNSPEDDVLPDITKDQNGNLVVTWTHEVSALDTEIGFAYSADSGAAWTAQLMTFDGIQRFGNSAYIDATIHDGGGTFKGIMGSWIDDGADTFGAYQIPDITDAASGEFGVWGEGGYPGIYYNTMEDNSWYLMTYFDQYGPVFAGVYDGNGLDRGLVCTWLDGVTFGSSVENWDAESAQPSGPAQDPAMANVHDSDPAATTEDYFYLVWQRNNGDTGKADIGYKQVVPVDESDIEYVDNYGFIVESTEYDAAHPDIGATSSRAVAVFMTNNNIYGDWDIGCAYTTDKGRTWTITTAVNQPQVDETYPAVYMSGNTVYCVYVKQGNLYLTKSEDGGVTWGDSTRVNDVDGTVVGAENAIDISQSGIVWTDTRNGNKDIYYAPLPAPVITVAITGGFGVQATISNEGTETAENLAWTVDLSGPVFVGKHTEGAITALAPGESQIVGPGLVLGIGPTTITVDAGGVSRTASGFVLGPLILGL